MDYNYFTDNDFADVFVIDEPTAHERVEERIQQLQSVTEQRRSRRRQLNSVHDSGDFLVTKDVERETIDDLEASKWRGCMRNDNSQLVEKALASAIDSSPAKKGAFEGAGIWYDCNICLELAKDPVLTCCGHLFCWPCFYQLRYIDYSTCRECPVCKGEVSDENVIPIYGNGGGEGECESGLKVPPQPKARRVELVRVPECVIKVWQFWNLKDKQTCIRNSKFGNSWNARKDLEMSDVANVYFVRKRMELPLEIDNKYKRYISLSRN